MMNCKFHTAVDIPKFDNKDGYKNKWMFVGSCFTENIGEKMARLKYPVTINPFGILYNPVSASTSLKFIIQRKKFFKNDLIFHNGLWHSFYHHSKFSSPDAQKTVYQINSEIESSYGFLSKADYLFLTFGTALVYEHKSSGLVVSNCHKIPDKEFRRYRLTPGEIVDDYRQLLPQIWQLNPELTVIFTVSPIRHWKDGAVENQLSKSTLLLAVDQIINEFGKQRCNYFPSYEIMMDELRDYRFYEEDMIHLSKAAINHIWGIFQNSFINDAGRQISKQIENIIDALNHRPFNKYTQEHLSFLKQSMQKVEEVKKKFPYINMAIEEEFFSGQIADVEEKIKNT